MIILFALFNALKPILLDSAFDALIPAVSILSMLGFVLLHGPRQIGWTRLLVFFIIAFIVNIALWVSVVNVVLLGLTLFIGYGRWFMA